MRFCLLCAINIKWIKKVKQQVLTKPVLALLGAGCFGLAGSSSFLVFSNSFFFFKAYKEIIYIGLYSWIEGERERAEEKADKERKQIKRERGKKRGKSRVLP